MKKNRTLKINWVLILVLFFLASVACAVENKNLKSGRESIVITVEKYFDNEDTFWLNVKQVPWKKRYWLTTKPWIMLDQYDQYERIYKIHDAWGNRGKGGVIIRVTEITGGPYKKSFLYLILYENGKIEKTAMIDNLISSDIIHSVRRSSQKDNILINLKYKRTGCSHLGCAYVSSKFYIYSISEKKIIYKHTYDEP